MTIKESTHDGIVVLTLKGNLVNEGDLSKLKEKVHGLLNNDIKKIIFDLGGVNFINSSGLGVLISSLTSVRNAGGEMCLAHLGDNVENLFVITKLIKVFETYETLEDALKSFSGKKK